MTYLVAALATVGAIALGAGALALIDRYLPEAEPPGLTDSTPRRPQRDPRAGKDGMHRPAALTPRTRGRLIAWSGAVRRAP